VVAKVRERLAVNKQRSHRFHMVRFNLKKLHEAEGKEQFRVEVSNRFGALEDFDAEVEPPLWSSGQSSWLQIQRSGFDSQRYQVF
jgi:hypothetical protein